MLNSSETGAAGVRDLVEDRRVRRSRRLLQDALLEMILEKGYDKVTVQDILDRADVGRATFYAHFRDKDDLLVSGSEQLREVLREQMSAFLAAGNQQPTERLLVTRVLFEHAARNRQLYRALIGNRGGGVILRQAQRDLTALFREHLDQAAAQQRVQPAAPVEIVVQYVVGALLALLTWWLDNDLSYSPAQMSAAFHRISHDGLGGALIDSRVPRGTHLE
jgi:AcrR family transcriptional regulator